MLLLSCAFIALMCSAANAAAITCNHESCNPAYEPFPNLHAAMVGYNVMEGNPFDATTLYDPGFKDFIFLPMIKNTQNKYELHPGVTGTWRKRCKLSIGVDIVTTIEGYQKTISRKESEGVDFASNNEVEIEVDGTGAGVPIKAKGKIPPVITASFSASKAFGENEAFFTKNKGVLAVSDAVCPAYSLSHSVFDPPPFSPQFVKGLKHLESKIGGTTAEKDDAFRLFIGEYGTHFLDFALMGARIAITSKYTESEYTKTGKTNIGSCNSHKIGVSVGFSVSEQQSKCKTTAGANSKLMSNGVSRYTITSYGSKPMPSLTDWAQQTFDQPVPIKMKLAPLTNLFREFYMKPEKLGETIDYQGILKYFGIRYWNYCENNKARYNLKTCDVKTQKGCGWNDNCARTSTSTCVNDSRRPTGYYCCDNPCGRQTCSNRGTCSNNLNSCTYTCTCQKGYTGNNCQSRYIDKDLLKVELTEQMRIGIGRTPDQFRGDVLQWLQRTYPGYRLSVHTMPQGGTWSWRGYGVLVKNTYLKNLFVFYSRSGVASNAATYANNALGLVKDKGCDASANVNNVNAYIGPKGGRDVLYVRFGSGLRSTWAGAGTYFSNHRCSRSCNFWGSCTNHESSLVTFW